MNKSELLEFLTVDNPGYKTKKKYLLAHFQSEINLAIQWCKDKNLQIDYTNLQQILWHWLYEYSTRPLCPISQQPTKFQSLSKGYNEYLSGSLSAKDPAIRAKVEQTNIEKYGTVVPLGNVIVKDKCKKTNLEKYGFESHLTSPLMQEKLRNGMVYRFGVDNWFRNENALFNRKEISTTYGFGSEHFQNKFAETHNGIKSWSQTKEGKLFLTEHLAKIRNVQKDKRISELIEIGVKYNLTFKCHLKDGRYVFRNNETGRLFAIPPTVFYQRICKTQTIDTNINPLGYSHSFIEQKIIQFLDEFNIKYVSHFRKHKFEIDLLLPDYNIGIEVNGLYWHSEVRHDKEYHQKKSLTFQEDNIRIIHLWEDDINYKFEIVKSRLLNLLKLNSTKIYARNCKIKEISSAICNDFLDANHLQGAINSKIRLGLFHNDELVSVMSFGKGRISMHGTESIELLRFCNLNNVSVIGGASKLFNYFIKNYQKYYSDKQIISYSEFDWGQSTIYKLLGFEFAGLTQPNYFYIVKNKRENRWKWRKSELVKLGFDKTKTEFQIMDELGHLRLWNSGNEKWIYVKKSLE